MFAVTRDAKGASSDIIGDAECKSHSPVEAITASRENEGGKRFR